MEEKCKCLVKTLLVKNLVGKNPSEGKIVHHFIYFTNYLIKNIARKMQWKNHSQGKKIALFYFYFFFLYFTYFKLPWSKLLL